MPSALIDNALLIARREYLERVRSKAFRISTVLIPLVFAGIFGVGFFSASHLTGDTHIVVASNDTAFAGAVRDELLGMKGGPKQVDVVVPTGPAELAALDEDVQDKRIDGYLWLQMTPGQPRPVAEYASRSSTSLNHGDMKDAVREAMLLTRLQERGVPAGDVRKLMAAVDVKTLQVKDGRAVESDARQNFWAAYVMMMLLYFTIIFYGLNVGRSVIEEKTSRIFEVMLASVQPESLMMGKLLGVGAAALTQLAIWAAIAAFYGSSQLAGSGLAGLRIPLVLPIFFVVYFILGFLFYSALSCGLGACMSTEQEMNQFSILITLPLILAFMMFSYVMASPNSALSVGLSLFPPCTPLIMCLRMGVQMPPYWQLALSIALMIAAIYLMLWLASRIYRVGILMYGKRPNLPEIVRWLRYT